MKILAFLALAVLKVVVVVVLIEFALLAIVCFFVRKKSGDNNDKEVCVGCWEDTGYDKSVPIDKRRYYVEGMGQLCDKCGLVFFSRK